MCSYLGTFPPSLARSLIATLTEPGDVVLDPFSGRGTTLLEARITGRIPLASDLNPIAIALSRAKNANVTSNVVLGRIDALEAAYDPLIYMPEAQVQDDNIALIFHHRTLAQLCYLRKRLINSKEDIDRFLVGCILGIMHGAERQDGTSAYASISMPNTFSMSPDYVRRFVASNKLQRADRNVFALLRDKIGRLGGSRWDFDTRGVVARADARALTSVPEFAEYANSVKLVLCSPPYLDVVNYEKQNWIRAWFLNQHTEGTFATDLDDNLTLSRWMDFAGEFTRQIRDMLSNDGVAVIVIGDVAKPGRSAMSLAREYIRLVHHQQLFKFIGCFSDHLQTQIKTTRIWKDTKGMATSVDRGIVLSNRPVALDWTKLGAHFPEAAYAECDPLSSDDLTGYARNFAGL